MIEYSAASKTSSRKEFWAAKSSWQQEVLVIEMLLPAKRVPAKKEFWAANSSWQQKEFQLRRNSGQQSERFP